MNRYHTTPIYIFFIAVLALPGISCMKDKGNYNYTAVNRVSIKGIDSSYIVDYGKRLLIVPDLEFTKDLQEDTTNYSYEWTVDHLLGYTMTPITLSTKRDLDTAIQLDFGSYYLYYRVTDKRTAVFTECYFYLTVSAPSYEGWLMLCDTEDGNSRLDMVSHVGTRDTLYTDILKKMNSAYVVTGKPAYVATGYSYIGGPANGTVAIFVATSKNAVILGLDTLQYEPSYDLQNVMSVSEPFTDWSNANLYLGVYSGILYANNNLYDVSDVSITGPVNTKDGGTALFTPSSWIGIPKDGGVSVVYDTTSGTFLRFPGFGNTCLTLPAGELFNFTTGMELLYMTYVPFSSGQVFAVLKNKQSGKRYLAYFTTAGKQNYYAEITGDGIENASHFAVSPDLGYLFYNAGGKVYEYDPSLKRSILMHDYGASTISLLKFQPFGATYEGAPNADYYNNLANKLLVCTYTKGLPAYSGKLDIYTVPDINGQIQLYQSFAGTGNVVSIAYRER